MALWFVTERPVVGRVFVAHGNGRVLATKLADPPEEGAFSAEDFVDYMRREFGVVVEQDQGPASPWPFNETREPFQAADLVDLRKLTDFQQRVMVATACIPPGDLRTYGEVAEGLGKRDAAMAVGQAMKSNPAPLVIPCHRVVGAGKLGGWVYGQNLKRSLLADEGVHLPIGGVSIGTGSPATATVVPSASTPPSLEERIQRGESQRMEFKSTAGRGGWRKGQHQIVASVCGFLNAEGGELIIGVADDKTPKGLAREHPPGKRFDPDDYERFLRDLLKRRLTIPTTLLVSVHFEECGGKTVCVVGVEPSPDDPVWAQPLDDDDRNSWGTPDRSGWEFLVRDGNGTRRLSGPSLVSYLKRRFPAS